MSTDWLFSFCSKTGDGSLYIWSKFYNNSDIPCTTNAHTHATTHWNTTMNAAHLPPSSRRIDAIAATHGVYSRQNTIRAAAAPVVIEDLRAAIVP